MPPAITTFLIEVVNFLLLAAGLGWLLFKPVAAALDRQRTAAEQETSALSARRAELDRAAADLDRRRAAFDAEMDTARQARLQAAERDADALVTRAREQAEQTQSRARQQLDALAREQGRELARAAATAGANAVRRLLDRLGGPDLDDALLEAACQQLEQMPSRPLASVVVESARPLADDDRTRLASAAAVSPSAVGFRVVSDLGAGVRVTTASGLVDASAAGLADYARQALDDALRTEADVELDR